MKTKRWSPWLVLVATLFVTWAAVGAQYGLGGFVHPWGRYDEGPFGLLNQTSLTVGPVVSLSEGATRWDFWYGVDPVQAGWIGEAPAPIEDRLVNVWLDELGWRVWYGAPLSVSASYSRLHCETTPVPAELPYEAGEWLAHSLTAGLGLRLGPFWALTELGMRWWNWLEVADAPDLETEFNLYLSAGFTVPFNEAGARSPYEPVEAFDVAVEELFPLDCGDWNWQGQVGRIDNLDGALHFVIREQQQRLMQQFPCDLGRFVLDVEFAAHASYTAQYYQGVILRYEDDDNFFAVDIRSDGYLRFVKVVEGHWETVRGWRRAIGYVPGNANRLRIVAPGNQFVIYLNGNRICRVHEVSFRKGDIALFAGTNDGNSHSVTFDNLRIREIPPQTVLDPRTVRSQEIELAQRTALTLLTGAGAAVSFLEGYDAIGFAFAAGALYGLLSDSTHIVYVE
jgi:hypothetical protein